MSKKRKSADDRIAELEAAVEAARRDLDEQWIEEEKRERERHMKSAIDDLRSHWHDFCDADYFEGSATFAERMEAAGLIQTRRVKTADLEEAFAADRGIEKGGWLWELTDTGRSALATKADPS